MLLQLLYSLIHERRISRACSRHDGEDFLIVLGQVISMSRVDIQDKLTVTNKFVLSDARADQKKRENRLRSSHLSIGVLYMEMTVSLCSTRLFIQMGDSILWLVNFLINKKYLHNSVSSQIVCHNWPVQLPYSL